MSAILKVIKLSKAFGGLMALHDINLEVDAGQIVGIIGPNGAGKTTLFNCLTSLYYPSEGQIVFQENAIVPQTSKKKMTIIEKCSLIFILLSLAWFLLFWSHFLPRTFFKVELSLLALFLLIIRLLVVRRLKQFQIWAWSVMFVFLSADVYLAIWLLSHLSSMGHLPWTDVSLVYFALPWSILEIPFSTYFVWQLLLRQVRQLYGFRLMPDAVSRLGVARTFQNIRLFQNLSVLDNVKIGFHAQMHSDIWRILFRTAFQRREEELAEKEAFEQLRFVGLEDRAFHLAAALAYGEQRRLEIARALASHPQLLLLDEPAAGMNPQESSQLIQLIHKIREKGLTILIIEHDMKVIMNLADKMYVLDHGELIAQGTPDDIRSDPRVIEAYLGRGAEHVET